MSHINYDYQKYWESCWNEEDTDALFGWLDGWNNFAGKEVEVFREFGVKTICDAACGFGSHTISFASNGFEVSAFDVSEKAVELTINGLRKYGYNAVAWSDHFSSNNDSLENSEQNDSITDSKQKRIVVKKASIMDTGYEDDSFDATCAFAVLDHLTEADAKKALNELLRITKPGGLVLLSFDNPEEGDPYEPHETLPDGSMVFTDDTSTDGAHLLFHPYDEKMINCFINKNRVVAKWTTRKNDTVIVLQK